MTEARSVGSFFASVWPEEETKEIFSGAYRTFIKRLSSMGWSRR